MQSTKDWIAFLSSVVIFTALHHYSQIAAYGFLAVIVMINLASVARPLMRQVKVDRDLRKLEDMLAHEHWNRIRQACPHCQGEGCQVCSRKYRNTYF